MTIDAKRVAELRAKATPGYELTRDQSHFDTKTTIQRANGQVIAQVSNEDDAAFMAAAHDMADLIASQAETIERLELEGLLADAYQLERNG